MKAGKCVKKEVKVYKEGPGEVILKGLNSQILSVSVLVLLALKLIL